MFHVKHIKVKVENYLLTLPLYKKDLPSFDALIIHHLKREVNNYFYLLEKWFLNSNVYIIYLFYYLKKLQ